MHIQPTIAIMPPQAPQQEPQEALDPALAIHITAAGPVPSVVQGAIHAANRQLTSLRQRLRTEQDPQVVADLAGQPDPADHVLARHVVRTQGPDDCRNFLAFAAAACLIVGFLLMVTKTSTPAGAALLGVGGISLLAVPLYDHILYRRAMRDAQRARSLEAGVDRITVVDEADQNARIEDMIELTDMRVVPESPRYDAVAPESPPETPET